MAAVNELQDQLDINHNNDNNNDNINIHENKNDVNNDEEKQIRQPLYKIVQHISMYGMREEDFETLNTAVAHWESLTYFLASIWYQWDFKKQIWNIKDSYGTVKATQKITDYMNNKYNNKINKQINNNLIPITDNNNQQSKQSIISYITSFVSNETYDNNNENKSEEQNIKLLDEFFKFTEIYTQKSGIKPINNLNNDDSKCNDLIVSLVWSVGFQCYFLKSFEISQQTWKSLGVWYSSVWFTRNAMGSFVVNDNFGTSDSIRKICRFVNESQENWNYLKKKKDIIDKRPLNENNDSIIIGKKNINIDDEMEEREEENDDSKLCIVCLDGNRDHIIIPCGHICICDNCKVLYDKND
eukprot:88838_1